MGPEPETNTVDMRYDTAGLVAYAANLHAFFNTLLRPGPAGNGMSRREALAVTLELVRSVGQQARKPE